MANIIPTPPPPLVDHLGRVIDFAALRRVESQPTVSGVRSIITGHPASGLTPDRLAAILRQAENGDATRYLELAEQMEERDLHYLGVLTQRKRAVSQLEISVEAAGDDAEAQADAELVREWIERESVEGELFDMLDAIGKGFSVQEIAWEMDARRWWPARLIQVDPRWTEFDRVDGRTLMLKGDDGLPKPLAPFKYVITNIQAKSGLPIRGGLAKPVAWAWMFKNYSVKDWMAFEEVYGLPLRLGRYDSNASPADRQILLRAVADIGSDAAAIIPKGMDIEFIDGKHGNADGALFQNAADWFDRQISKAVLGQTMTTDAQSAGLGSGQANVQDGVRADIERADAKSLANALNRDVVQPLVMLNRGPRRRYPLVKIGRAESWDAVKQMEAVRTFVDMGGKVGMSTIRDRLGLPDPGKDEELLAPTKTAATPPIGAPTPPVLPELASQRFLGLLNLLTGASDIALAAQKAGGAPIAPVAGDAIDQLAAIAAEDWAPMMAPIKTAIGELLASCSSYEEVQARLSEAMAADPSAFVDTLARAAFVARLHGTTAADEV